MMRNSPSRCREGQGLAVGRIRARNLRARDGFTLIELLVVIAILALLLSLLMPSLRLAKELAWQAKCMTQFKSHMTGYLLYAHDWDDYIVTTCLTHKNSTDPAWAVTHLGRKAILDYIVGDHGLIVTETRYHPFFLCPVAVREQDGGERGAWNSMGWSRVFDGQSPCIGDGRPEDVTVPARGGGTVVLNIYPRRFSDLEAAGRMVAEADVNWKGFSSIRPRENQVSGSFVEYRHLQEGMANIALADGHAEKITTGDGFELSGGMYSANRYK